VTVTAKGADLVLLARRWLRFTTVGGMGIVVQLVVLAILKGLLAIDYLLATALAVEIAVLHNFVWHERWTWSERTRGRRRTLLLLERLLRFNLTTGMVSILSNLVLMRLLVGQVHLHYLLANLLTIAICSLANFLVSEMFVFQKPKS
jgi:putative flippase GtrA